MMGMPACSNSTRQFPRCMMACMGQGSGTSLNWADHETLAAAIAGTMQTPPAIVDKIKGYMAD